MDIKKLKYQPDYMQKRLLKIYCWIFLIGVSYLLFVRITGIRIPCFYYETTGFLCPGCGITRMFVQLSKFNIQQAFWYNPVCFCLLVFWVIMSVLLFVGKPNFLRRPKVLYSLMIINITVLLIFGCLRNFG